MVGTIFSFLVFWSCDVAVSAHAPDILSYEAYMGTIMLNLTPSDIPSVPNNFPPIFIKMHLAI